MQNPQYVKVAVEAIKARISPRILESPYPPCGVVLGTGLSTLKDRIAQGFETMPFEAIPQFPLPGVESHAGSFSFGFFGAMPLIIQQGRSHLYEGRTPEEVCRSVRVMAALGCDTIIVTNAAGALNPLFKPGAIMCLADMINFTGQSPLTGAQDSANPFPDMSCPFDASLRQLATEAALTLGIPLEHGVYIQVHGPEMETPAETRMYRGFGADAIGMSTALEVIAARQLGMRCLGFSCLTNKNLPDCMSPAPLAEILEVAAASGATLARLLIGIFERLSTKPADSR